MRAVDTGLERNTILHTGYAL